MDHRNGTPHQYAIEDTLGSPDLEHEDEYRSIDLNRLGTKDIRQRERGRILDRQSV